MILALLLATSLAQSQSPALPVPVELRIPEYPETAIKARISGVVEVTLSVSPDGTVASAVASQDAPLLISGAAVRAAREWRFVASADVQLRQYVVRFEFAVDVDAPSKGGACFVGTSSAVVLLPLQTVRIRGWLRHAVTSN